MKKSENPWSKSQQYVIHSFSALNLFFYLLFAALAGLQARQDLALNSLNPCVPLLIGRGLKIPGLSRQRNNDELKVVLLF